ncbi:hypothetical protein C9374_014442 [Naegleria lovaniensis]|uniref:Chromatin-remodeling ATPase INO80 n=1 Tax=Naegleria lovaniensis TaxID=51637 RepID=A0AA88GXU5_NAELO|nr:uncharacterized protein C9374_014442 [Naegleria lovaniensis]KAG2389042.1 hypothetical protein C9374_014442 [Naegleria lovaniensis]
MSQDGIATTASTTFPSLLKQQQVSDHQQNSLANENKNTMMMNGSNTRAEAAPITTTNHTSCNKNPQNGIHPTITSSSSLPTRTFSKLYSRPSIDKGDCEFLLELETSLSNKLCGIDASSKDFLTNHEEMLILPNEVSFSSPLEEAYDRLGDFCNESLSKYVQHESGDGNTKITQPPTNESSSSAVTSPPIMTNEREIGVEQASSKYLEELFDAICEDYLSTQTYEELIPSPNDDDTKKRKPGEGVKVHIRKNSALLRDPHKPTLLVSTSLRKTKRPKKTKEEKGSFEVAFEIPMNNFNAQYVVEEFQNCMSSHYHFSENNSQLKNKKNWIDSFVTNRVEFTKQLEDFSRAIIHQRLNETLTAKTSLTSRGATTTSFSGRHSRMLQLAREAAAKINDKHHRERSERESSLDETSSVLSDRLGTFWKRHEKEISEKRKRKKKEEEEKEEALRQQRKLNFLLSQTELYSHFMSRKVSSLDQTGASSNEDGEQSSRERALQASEKQKQYTMDFDAETGKYRTQLDEDKIETSEDIQEEPNIFNGTLKKYQLKGMKWLVSLYEQGINGILADEMGLGKTIQTIAFIAYLAEKKGIWGPTLIITPSSTLHNWQQEFEKFCPTLRVLPYWGALKERKLLRKYWTNPDKLYQKDSPFHVVISSYGLILEDEKYFKKVKWQYLILDEAHAIKSSKSLRWKTLLGMKCRNRMLLTGTPIQNNMKELWALLHFIMPSIFDSHDEFNDWFSKDIESHASKEQDAKLNEQQLARLHMILKPFMLRRVKKDVESEMAPKTELVLHCGFSSLQAEMYKYIKDDFKKNSAKEKKKKKAITAESAANKSALMNIVMQLKKACNHIHLFKEFRQYVVTPVAFSEHPGHVKHIPGKIYDEYENLKNPISLTLPKIVFREMMPEGSLDTEAKQLSIFKRFNFSQDPSYLLHNYGTLFYYLKDSLWRLYKLRNLRNRLVEFRNRKKTFQFFMDELVAEQLTAHIHRCDMLIHNIETLFRNNGTIIRKVKCCFERVMAPPIEIRCSDRSSTYHLEPVKTTRFIDKKFLYRNRFVFDTFGSSNVVLPNVSKLIADSGKMRMLDQLLFRLKMEGHRVLIFCQMTKMIDLLEDYMIKRRYTYFRLDGSTGVAERRDMVDAFQNQRVDPVFAFLLSTKAGGLGITLTAADTVIFYDSDWNPTLDAQAMDRVHRIGQTKPVTIYRLITKNSVEERILTIAKQKSTIQETVYKGQFKMQDKEEDVDTSEMDEDDDAAVESAVVVDDAGDLDEKEIMSLILD